MRDLDDVVLLYIDAKLARERKKRHCGGICYKSDGPHSTMRYSLFEVGWLLLMNETMVGGSERHRSVVSSIEASLTFFYCCITRWLARMQNASFDNVQDNRYCLGPKPEGALANS
jgi:hypothetical protein